MTLEGSWCLNTVSVKQRMGHHWPIDRSLFWLFGKQVSKRRNSKLRSWSDARMMSPKLKWLSTVDLTYWLNNDNPPLVVILRNAGVNMPLLSTPSTIEFNRFFVLYFFSVNLIKMNDNFFPSDDANNISLKIRRTFAKHIDHHRRSVMKTFHRFR